MGGNIFRLGALMPSGTPISYGVSTGGWITFSRFLIGAGATASAWAMRIQWGAVLRTALKSRGVSDPDSVWPLGYRGKIALHLPEGAALPIDGGFTAV